MWIVIYNIFANRIGRQQFKEKLATIVELE